MCVHQRAVGALRFSGGTFVDSANHEMPRVSAHKTTGFKGVHDHGGTCYPYDMLLPVYSIAVAMVTRLCVQLDQQQAPVYPSLDGRV